MTQHTSTFIFEIKRHVNQLVCSIYNVMSYLILNGRKLDLSKKLGICYNLNKPIAVDFDTPSSINVRLNFCLEFITFQFSEQIFVCCVFKMN